MRTAEQWASMGKEALLLLANSLNIHTKGKSLNIVQLLMAHFDSEMQIRDGGFPQHNVETEVYSDDADMPLVREVPRTKPSLL